MVALFCHNYIDCIVIAVVTLLTRTIIMQVELLTGGIALPHDSTLFTMVALPSHIIIETYYYVWPVISFL